METRELVEAIVKAMVDHPESVVCTELEGTQSSVIEVRVHSEDLGKIIGRKGTYADAIRKIVQAIGGKRKKRYLLEIIDPGR